MGRDIMYIDKFLSPIERQPFIWFAKYGENDTLTEFEDNGKENEWNTIEKDRLIEFGLIGRGAKLFYSINDGIINVMDKQIKFFLQNEDGSTIKLNNREGEIYNDIVQFKGFYNEYDPMDKNRDPNKPLENIIDSFHFGYKHKIELPQGILHVEHVFRLPLGKPMKLGFRLTPNFELDSKLVVRVTGMKDQIIDIHVRANPKRKEESLFEADFF